MQFRSIGGPSDGAFRRRTFEGPLKGPSVRLSRPSEPGYRFPPERVEQMRRDIEEVMAAPNLFSTPAVAHVLRGFENPPPLPVPEKEALRGKSHRAQIWFQGERREHWQAAILPDLPTVMRWMSTLQNKIDVQLEAESLDVDGATTVATYATLLRDLSQAWRTRCRPHPGDRPDPAWRLDPILLRKNRGTTERVQAASLLAGNDGPTQLMFFGALQSLRDVSERMAEHSIEAYQHTWHPEAILRLQQFDAAFATVEGVRRIKLGPEEYGFFVQTVDQFCLQDPAAMAQGLEEKAWRRSGGDEDEFPAWKRAYLRLMDHLVEALTNFISREPQVVEPHLSDALIERLVRFPFLFQPLFRRTNFSFHFIGTEEGYRGVFSKLEERFLRQMVKEAKTRPGIAGERFVLREGMVYNGAACFLHYHRGIALDKSDEIVRFFDADDLTNLIRSNHSLPARERAIAVSQWFHFARAFDLFAPGDVPRVIQGLAEWIGDDRFELFPEDHLGL